MAFGIPSCIAFLVKEPMLSEISLLFDNDFFAVVRDIYTLLRVHYAPSVQIVVYFFCRFIIHDPFRGDSGSLSVKIEQEYAALIYRRLR